MPYGVGRSLPPRTAATPGISAAARMSMERISACGVVARRILQWSIRGRNRSSAKRVRPVTLATASTFGSERPTTRRSGVDGGPPPGGGSGFAIQRLMGCLGRLAAHARGGQLHGLVDLQVAGAAAEVPAQGLDDLGARRRGRLLEKRLAG